VRTAYVIIRFRIRPEDNAPVFRDAGIYSEPTLTTINPLDELQFKLFESEGEDFRDAACNAMLAIQNHPRWRWLLTHISSAKWRG
jgi:hypothetical protein